MASKILREVPNPDQLIAAVSHEDSITVQTQTGEQYAFSPSRLAHQGGIKGMYSQLAKGGQFVGIRGEAVLYIYRDKNVATLELFPS